MLRLALAALAVTFTIQASNTVSLALVGGRIHPAPDAAPVDDGVVVVENGRIVRLGPRKTTPIADGARVIDCTGLVVVAGFQNSHVHFTDPRWLDAAKQPAPTIRAQLDEMLTRYTTS